VFAEIDPPGQTLELVGFDSPSRGPLVVLIRRTTAPDVRVFDATSGTELGSFPEVGRRLEQFGPAVHIYESADGPVLVLVVPGKKVGQWLLPDGQPVHTPIEAGADERAVTSYLDGDRRVLVVADALGKLRRFDAVSGAPIGAPTRFRPRPGLLARLSGKAGHPGWELLPRALAVDETSVGPAVLVADGRHGLWRVEPDGTSRVVPVDPPLSVIGLSADPLGRPHAAGLRSGNRFAVHDIRTGELLSGPVEVPAVLDDVATAICATATGGRLSVFMAVGARLLRLTGGDTEVLLGPPMPDHEEEEDEEEPVDYFVDGLCTLPLGAGTAVFADDSSRIYRFAG